MKNPHAIALGSLGGKAKSEAKTKAARLNAKKPRKIKAQRNDALAKVRSSIKPK